MVEFLFTENNNSFNNEEQSSEYFNDVSTSNMLNINLDILFSLTQNTILCLAILFHNFYLATPSLSIGFIIGF